MVLSFIIHPDQVNVVCVSNHVSQQPPPQYVTNGSTSVVVWHPLPVESTCHECEEGVAMGEKTKTQYGDCPVLEIPCLILLSGT
jgi:hypothetical protein